MLAHEAAHTVQQARGAGQLAPRIIDRSEQLDRARQIGLLRAGAQRRREPLVAVGQRRAGEPQPQLGP